MNIVMDSDMLIYFLKGQPEVVNKLSMYPIEQVFTTRINVTELLYGAFNSAKVDYNLTKINAFLARFTILEFDRQASVIFAQEKARLKQKGILIADMDLMIASITLAHDYALVTNNIKHFDRINNLKIERWLSN
ncbi:MAG: PIN domain-containing protein [Methylococcaceae bacterium]|nr:PIN domain-containing protein [Methylococcaceae bacterium]